MKKYYLHNGTEQKGPFDIDELKEQNLNKETHVWYDGLPEWIPAGQLDELKSAIKIVPPPFAPKAPTQQPMTTFHKPVTPPPVMEPKEATVKPAPKKKRKKPILRIVFVLLALTVLGLGGIYAFNEVNQQVEKQEKEDAKERIRNNINLYVTASNNVYSASSWGGIYGLEITVTNETDYLIDNARVKITYIKSNGSVWKDKKFDFSMINPHSSLTLRIPDTERGTSIQYEITAIKSNALGLY